MDNESRATQSSVATAEETPSTPALANIPDATIGNDQYSVLYSTTGFPLDTLNSYSVGGRPVPINASRVPSSLSAGRVHTSAPKRNSHAGLVIVLLALVAVGFVVTTHARRPSQDRVNVSATADQTNLESGQAPSILGNAVSPAAQKAARSAARLSKLANTVNQNQKLPRMVEDYMQEIGAKGSEGVLTYRYRMTKVVASEFDSTQFLASQRLAAMKTQCGNPEDTGNLLSQGVVVRCTYLDMRNAEITTFDITSDDCP